MSEAPIIEVRNASKYYGVGEKRFRALSGVNLKIQPGTFVSLLGPSGCGKSTILNAIAGLVQPSEGAILFQGKPVTRVNTGVGYVTQNDALLPWRTVERNVRIGLEIQRVKEPERSQRVDQMLSRVGLKAFAKRYPSELSGGMRKRASLARSLICAPGTIMMDEPFAAVDAQLRAALHQQLLDIWQEEQKTVVFVTHDLEEAITLSDKIIVMGTKPGRVVAEINVTLARPRDVFELRTSAEYVELYAQLWALLGDQIKSAMADGSDETS